MFISLNKAIKQILVRRCLKISHWRLDKMVVTLIFFRNRLLQNEQHDGGSVIIDGCDTSNHSKFRHTIATQRYFT